MAIPERDPGEQLTELELHVLELAATDLTPAAIAELLGISIEELVASFEQVLWKLQIQSGPRAASSFSFERN